MAELPAQYSRSKFVQNLAKRETSASKRATKYRRELDAANSAIGLLPVQIGAMVSGAASGMIADDAGQIMGSDAPLVMGIAGVAIGSFTNMPFVVKAAQGPLAAWSYEFGSNLFQGE